MSPKTTPRAATAAITAIRGPRAEACATTGFRCGPESAPSAEADVDSVMSPGGPSRGILGIALGSRYPLSTVMDPDGTRLGSHRDARAAGRIRIARRHGSPLHSRGRPRDDSTAGIPAAP
ncbi:hypothetical protein GCM10023087_21790 [Microbacterium rhizosphaerae]